uniref:CCDC144C-like coiled-coil domain-containing protein n=1 Tax=Esox lucius TaxID=8010 RepID=A0A3P8YE53_ESOLU
MKKIFNFTKKKKGFSPNTSDTGSVLSVGYDLKEKDLGKVHKAAYGGDLAKLKQLAKKNDINQLDKENRTALHFACANGQTDVVQFLVEIKAKLNLCDNQNRSPLMKAVQCQQERCVATLLEHDADPNLVDINGNTALHLASCIPAVSTAILLLEHEANVNAQNKEGYSPLTMAVKENHAEMAEFLLKEGADVNIKDRGHRWHLPEFTFLFVDFFYIPSFLRGSQSFTMAYLEPGRSVAMPRGNMGPGGERDRQGRLVDKMCQLEAQQVELRDSLEESRDSKQALDHRQLELDTDLNNLKFQLKQEQEKHRNASMLYEKTRVLLRKKEEDLRTEAEGKHKVELALRNLELEKRAILNNMKQLEEDRSETQKLLNQERGARALSETLLNNNLRKQQEIEEENRRTICKSNEALSQLTEATDRERELLQQNSALQDDLSSLRVELERSRSHSRQEESRLTEECEALREHLEDARRDLKLNEEALAQMVYQYTGQLTTLKAELSVTSTRLEHERQAREQLEAEGESGRTRLTGALQEAERCQAARADAERALQREREERQRAQDKLTGETANKREAVGGLSQKLAKAESRTNSLENEVHRLTMALTETEHMVTALQREKEVAMGRLRELEAALQVEREQAVRACARQEALQERLAVTQSEGMLIRQHLEEAQNKGMAKEKAVTDAQERFGDLLAKLRADGEEHVQLVEERSRELATKAAELRDQVYKLEEEKNERETVLRQLQQELADSLKKLSMSEASLEVNTRYRNDLEEEKARLLKDMDRLKGKVGGMELEKKKVKKIAEQKKSVDNRLDQEMKRNTELQKEIQTLPLVSMSQVDDLSVQLQKEASRCSQLERVNKELKEQLVSFKNLGRSNERLERSKKHLEEELLGLRQQVELGVIDQSQVDHYRREAEERARQEIRQKLEEVNIFLQTQAASQEALDQIKAASEASLRSTLEQRIRELEGELGRARSTQQDSMNLRDSTHTELERYRELYMEELRLRKSLAAKLER